MKGVPLSYSQIYFSKSLWLGLVLLIVSFADLGVGVSGLIAIAVCQLCAVFFSFNRVGIFDGAYTFNALMVGLAMGGLYQVGLGYIVVLVIASMFTFFLTVWLSGRLSMAGLPMLSLPFLVTIWTLFLGLSNFSGFALVTKQEYSIQQWFPQIFTSVNAFFDSFPIRDVLHLYLRSLSAIFFQYNDLAGAIIALALLLHSRMSFALTIYGFLIGYFFYYYLEGDFTPLVYSYIGFNFILTAIALGGFFIVPSAKSHLLLLFVVPITALLLSGMHTVFSYFKLPLFSLPFNVIVVLMIGVLHMRFRSGGLQLVTLQQYSPEENHYKSIYYAKRFLGQTYYHINLPVTGEWHISQGHEGDITHKEGWKHAWDFDIRDKRDKTYEDTGLNLKDYYCYEQPVVAPCYGWVVKVQDGIPDNVIGDINFEQNWGNTIIIKHAEGLYSKLSHLKGHSINVKEGDYVRTGEVIASCGNSGRSPEPHLHFQLQATPYIGSQTLKYPVSYFLTKEDVEYKFHAFEYPKEGDTVRNIVGTPILVNAFGMIAGRELNWNVSDGKKQWTQSWQVYVDMSNKTYIYCRDTKATAYFVNDGNLFYFTDFYGSRGSLLYLFYLSSQRILLGCYRGVTLKDWLLPQYFFNPLIRSVQDFVAPFYHFLEGVYKFRFSEVDSYDVPQRIVISTESQGELFKKAVGKMSCEIIVDQSGIQQFRIKMKNKEITATCA